MGADDNTDEPEPGDASLLEKMIITDDNLYPAKQKGLDFLLRKESFSMAHLGHFRLFEAFEKGCPICQIIREDTLRSMDSLLYEHVNDPVMRRDLREKWLCNRHAWQFRAQGDAFGQSILYRDILEKLKGSLGDNSNRYGTEVSLKGGGKDKIRGRCIFCDKQDRTEERLISILHENYREPAFRSRYVQNFGICIPHLFKIAGTSRDQDIVEYFFSVERAKLSTLIDELGEFIRKHDYRFSHESFNTERDAWVRAIEKVNGKNGVF